MTELNENTELPLTFNFSKTFEALKTFIDGYNKEHPGLKEKINASHRATAELIIRLYLKQLNKLTAITEYSLVNMPSFRTYMSSLAACKGCTVRTLYNHKERLIKAGFIKEIKRHAGDGIEVWVNPEVMWKGAYKVQKLEEGGTSLTPVYNHIEANRKKIQGLVHELQEHNNINSNVYSEKGVRHEPDKCVLPHGEDETGAFDKSTRKNAADLNEREAKEALATVLNAHILKKDETNPSPEPEKMPQPHPKQEKQEQQAGGAARIFHIKLVRNFWQYAKNALYPDKTFKDYEEKSILNSIWTSVYRGFKADYTERQWENYHESCLTRIRMVCDYLKRSPDRWIAPADLYFCPYNVKNGFKKTWKWYLKQETLKLQVRNEIELQKMKRQLEDHQRGKGRHKHLSRYELFNKHRKHLERLNDDMITRAYLSAYNKYIIAHA
ncbi:hypothetical protein JMN32_05415 [Fulvivirga sp. 29W222]|uniref:Replication protein n=1 Tax=Fulvivirga marina TaxID=2494733 RepID=A0A937FW76_9BACT|nr:hypothetical protein [Fulvivirga marina]MBL6445737.1 hypothetical protein [Fulvivirga marina]